MAIVDLFWFGGLMFWAWWLWKYKTRPNHSEWYPVANAGPGDKVNAYLLAAKKIGVDVTIRAEVPCPAGPGWGLRGVWIRRSQASRTDELSNAMWDAYEELTH
jgi:hypothetical protein